MPRSYLLGIDTGTSVVKAALFDLDGREVITAQCRTTLLSPQPGWSETDMLGTWQACIDVIRELLAQPAAQGATVEAVGLSGNMIGAWMIDAEGQPVRNAILWNDARTQALIERLNTEQPGFMARIFGLNGCVMESGCTLPLIRWFADHDPDALRRARAIFSSKDWICFKLTGAIQIDPTEAAGLPGNTFTQHYDDALFDMFGIANYRHLLPPVRPSESIVGTVLPEAARLTGLKAGTPVVAGAGDVPANALGIGAVTPGIAFTVLGTNCQACLVYDRPVFEPAEVGLLFYIPGRRWFRALMNVAGTTNLDWFIAQFCAEEQRAAASREDLYQRVERLAGQSDIGANGILYHPYLSPAGVIAPFVEPAARAQYFGLTDRHHRADMLRAIYEGVALAIRDCYTALGGPVEKILFAGGGARSAFWSQIIADCLGAEVAVPEGREFGAKGAALLAGVGIGLYEDILSASQRALQLSRSYLPQPAHHAQYTARYTIFRELRDVVRPAWKQLAHLYRDV